MLLDCWSRVCRYLKATSIIRLSRVNNVLHRILSCLSKEVSSEDTYPIGNRMHHQNILEEPPIITRNKRWLFLGLVKIWVSDRNQWYYDKSCYLIDTYTAIYRMDMNISRMNGVYFLSIHRYHDILYTPIEVHTLDLSYCTGVRNVSNLRKVHTLLLQHCSEVEDVSPLKNVHNLSLINCKKVTNVSSLEGVHTLDLSYCTGINDVSSLGKVHNLSLHGCTNVTDVSSLGEVYNLDLSYCTEISDVSLLKKFILLTFKAAPK
jgi:hypothetical protein